VKEIGIFIKWRKITNRGIGGNERREKRKKRKR
jgi:hypothetical protein